MRVGSRSGKLYSREGLCHPRSSSFADVACIQSHRIIYLFISEGFTIALVNIVVDKPLFLVMCARFAGTLTARMVIHYVTFFSTAELRTYPCEPVRKMPHLGRIGSTFDGERRSQLFKNHKTIISIVNEPPSWWDAGGGLQLMSDPKEVGDDIPDNKDS